MPIISLHFFFANELVSREVCKSGKQQRRKKESDFSLDAIYICVSDVITTFAVFSLWCLLKWQRQHEKLVAKFNVQVV